MTVDVPHQRKEHSQIGDRITAIYHKLHDHSDQDESELKALNRFRLQPRPFPEYQFYEPSEWADFIDPDFPKLTHAALTQRMYFLLNTDGSHVLTPDWAKRDGAWSREAREVRKDVANNVKALCRVLRMEDVNVVIPEKFEDWETEWKERLYAMTYPLYPALAICAEHYKIHLVVDSLDSLWKNWIKQFNASQGNSAELVEVKAEPEVEEITTVGIESQ